VPPLDLADPVNVGTRERERVAPSHRLVGLTQAQALDAEIPARNELIEDVIDRGTVGLIPGVPFSRKSWVA